METNENEVMDRQFMTEGDGVALGWSAFSQVSDPSELVALNEIEELELDQSAKDALRAEVLMGMLGYFLRGFRKSGSVEEVGERVVAMAMFVGHSSVDGLSLSKLAKLSGGTPATWMLRVRRECNEMIEAMGGVAKARWQQPEDQRAASAEVQKGNSNRNKNAKKSGRVTLAERRDQRG